MSRLLWVALVVGVGACSQDRREENINVAQSEIQGGSMDGQAHPYAMGMCQGSPGNCSYICSGALIAPNLIMTARHCVQNVPQTVDCTMDQFGAQKAPTGNFWFTTYNSVFQNSQGWVQAASITTPSGTFICGNDIALIITKTSVPSNVATPVTPLVWDLMTNHMKYSTSHTAIGFGNDGTTGSGVRRIKQNMVIQCIPGDKQKPCPPQVNVNEFYSDDGVCAGDSGSSAYEQLSFNANMPITFGVVSRAGLQNGKCLGSIYERTDKHTQLIVQVAQQAAQMGGYQAPPWTIQPPPMDAGSDAAPDTGSGGTQMQGDTCTMDTECAKPLVCQAGWNGSICTQACDANTPCPDGFTCQSNANGSFCFPPKPEPPDTGTVMMPPPPMPVVGGCMMGGSTPSLSGALALLFLLRRKRR